MRSIQTGSAKNIPHVLKPDCQGAPIKGKLSDWRKEFEDMLRKDRELDYNQKERRKYHNSYYYRKLMRERNQINKEQQ